MPIYMEISRLHRCVTIVARGTVSSDEIMAAAEQLVEAEVPAFAKLVDVAGATAEVRPEQIRRMASVLRRVGNVRRGPVAFLIDRQPHRFRARLRRYPARPAGPPVHQHPRGAWLAGAGRSGRAAAGGLGRARAMVRSRAPGHHDPGRPAPRAADCPPSRPVLASV
jgi:hypothetical protein